MFLLSSGAAAPFGSDIIVSGELTANFDTRADGKSDILWTYWSKKI
jgi:hypothetical protein